MKNDGTLKPFKESQKILGVDPAQNIAKIANERNSTISEFFGIEIANNIVKQHGKADIVFARNVIPHVADAKCSKMLKRWHWHNIAR